MYERLSRSFPVCFLYNILVLNIQAKGNQPQKITRINYAVLLPRFVYLALLAQVFSIKKIMRITTSITENIVTDGYFSVGCTTFIYSWGALKQEPLTLSHITSGSTFRKKLKRYLTVWPNILIQFLVKDLFERSPSLIVLQDVEPMVYSVCTLRVHQKITFYSKGIYCARLNHSYKFFMSLQLQSPMFYFSSIIQRHCRRHCHKGVYL